MGMRVFEFIFESASIFFLVMTPLVMVWGWIRWARREKKWTILAILSLTGFTLATASALLAVSSWIYSRLTGGFPYFDPKLMKIYALGALVSASALILSLMGIWRLNSLRWHALFCSFGTLVFWFAVAGTE
jgi:hypothetical protein